MNQPDINPSHDDSAHDSQPYASQPYPAGPVSRFDEPPIDPMADTGPNQANLVQPRSGGSGRAVGLLLLLLAAILTTAAFVMLLSPTSTTLPESTQIAVLPNDMAVETINAPEDSGIATPTLQQTDAPTAVVVPTDVPVDAAAAVASGELATLDPARLQQILQTPVAQIGQRQFVTFTDPFTISPERDRTEFTQYEVRKGDTVDAIARLYGLETESLAWCNDRSIVQVIRPGDVLTIPPTDGACYKVLGSRNQTITQIAADYQVDEVRSVVDSPYNPNLFGKDGEYVPPGGTTVFIPGGQGPLITWNPGTSTQTDAQGNVTSVSFAPGQPGSCGFVPQSGGTYWSNPLPNGTWVRGFYAGHTGIDLAQVPGAPVYAANSGGVLFSGFSQWGYGNTIVLGHGPFSTLYGHLSGRNLSCGQTAAVGDIIGTVGSTGNSSGPHLHFEIRYNDQPSDPSGTPGIGW